MNSGLPNSILITPSDSHQKAFCWEYGARLTDTVSLMSAFSARWLDSDLESRYENDQNGGLDIG